MAETADEELLTAWRAGDKAAGGQLFARHFEALYRFFTNKLAEERDDLIQRTFLACVESRDAVRQASSFRAYLLTIARRQLLMHLRQRIGRGEHIEIGDVSLADLCPSPSKVIAERDEEMLLLVALRMLPLELQTLLELFYWESLPIAQLAEICEVPLGTIKSRLHRARRLLEEQLARLEATPEARAAALEVWNREAGQRELPDDDSDKT